MKVKVIIPYFGEFHPLFKIYAKGIKHNSKFDFLIITDQNIICNTPSNLSILNMSFHDFTNVVYDKLGVAPRSPYKLCDFKPFYGVIFEEYLRNYDYWSYSDIDMILGDMDLYHKLMKKNRFDKILDRGHLSFYKNLNNVNYLYKCNKDIETHYNYLLKSKRIWVIDESYSEVIFGVNTLLQAIGKNVYSSRKSFFDTSPKYIEFTNINEDKKVPGFIEYKNNKVLYISICNNKILKQEFSYAHFLKRKVRVIDSGNSYILVPISWKNINSYDECIVKLKSLDKLTPNNQYDYFLLKNKFKNLTILIGDMFFNKEPVKILFKLLKIRILNLV